MNEEQPGGSGSNDRATVALVNSKIDTVLAKVEGNAQTTDAHFATIKVQLEAVRGLAGRMDTVEQKVTAVQAIVDGLLRGREYRTKTLPPILIGLTAVAVAVVSLVLAGHP